MKAPWCVAAVSGYSLEFVLRRIGYLVFICIMSIQAKSYARTPISKNLQLKATNGSLIDANYTIENLSPNEMGGTSLLVTFSVIVDVVFLSLTTSFLKPVSVA